MTDNHRIGSQQNTNLYDLKEEKKSFERKFISICFSFCSSSDMSLAINLHERRFNKEKKTLKNSHLHGTNGSVNMSEMKSCVKSIAEIKKKKNNVQWWKKKSPNKTMKYYGMIIFEKVWAISMGRCVLLDTFHLCFFGSFSFICFN